MGGCLKRHGGGDRGAGISLVGGGGGARNGLTPFIASA